MAITKEDILNAVSEMSVMDVCELVKMMESKFGVSAQAAVASGPAASVAEEAVVEEQTEFTVILTGFGAKKVQVIKVVRQLTGLGLKEAKAAVEGTPYNIKEGVSKEEAETIKKTLEESGASAEIK